MTKIVREELELEEFAMSGGGCIAVPIQIDADTEGNTVITVYSRFESEAGELSSQFGDLFSPEALGYIDSRFSAPMRKAGYEYEKDFCHTVLNYEAKKGSLAEIDAADAVFIDTNEKLKEYCKDTSRDFEIDDKDPLDVAFAVIADGKAVSVASVNDLSDDGAVEINVETAPAYRGRGYGACAVSKLCAHLLSLGERVTYKCRETNGASRRVAEKCGLVYRGKTYSYVCYKEEQGE